MITPDDRDLRLVQALEGIWDELKRIQLAQGACDSTFQTLISGGMYGHHTCSLRYGHIGMHEDGSDQYSYARWWSPEVCPHEWRAAKRDYFTGNQTCHLCGSWREVADDA